jgi:hypothetical protein
MNIWETLDGRKLKTSEISDDHLKNIVKHIRKYLPVYGIITYIFFLEVARARGISIAQLRGDPLPWVDPKDGKLKTYDPLLNEKSYTEVVRQ